MAYSVFMVAMPTTLPDLNTLDADTLRALLLATHEQLLSRDHEIEHLKLLIAKLRRMQFGRKSEKIERQIEQLELQLEDLEANRAESVPTRQRNRLRHRTRFHRRPSPRDVRFPIIFHARLRSTSLLNKPVPSAAAH